MTTKCCSLYGSEQIGSAVLQAPVCQARREAPFVIYSLPTTTTTVKHFKAHYYYLCTNTSRAIHWHGNPPSGEGETRGHYARPVGAMLGGFSQQLCLPLGQGVDLDQSEWPETWLACISGTLAGKE